MAGGTTTLVDPALGVQVIDESGLDIDAGTVWDSVRHQPEVAAMVRWVTSITGANEGGGRGGRQTRAGTLFRRDRYLDPGTVFEQMMVARDAAESDDIVSGVADTTEALAFNRMSFLAKDEDEEDIWNQLAGDLDLDSRLREMWRELFIFSQFYCCIWWGRKSYKVRGQTEAGNAKRKTFEDLEVPLGLTLLDPLKIVPIGGLLFNQEQLAYLADPFEIDMLDAAASNRSDADPLARQLILEKYEPGEVERRQLANAGITINHLYRLNPANVFRHTLTRPQYQRFSAVRMRSVFEILDLKAQLRQMDRAHLVGGTNFIVLVKKGSDQFPAKPAEVTNLQAQVRTVAQVPVIVGDHRLQVEIVTPKTDNTLDAARYNGLNAALTARLYGMFNTGNFSAGAKNDDSIKLAMVVARGMEGRRRQLKRVLERHVIQETWRRNDRLTTDTKLRFHPSRIELTFDPATVQFLIDMRDRGDISRESYVGELDVDQADEAVLREREKDRYDDIFQPTNVPFDGPAALSPGPDGKPKLDPRTAGRTRGGNKNGGGAAPGSGQGKAPRAGTPKDKPKKAGRAAATEGDDDAGDDDT